MSSQRRSWSSLLAILFALLAGCEDPTAADAPDSAVKPNPEGVGVLIDSVNYLHHTGMKYTLYDSARADPVGGSIVDPLGSGGDKGCCLALPKVWHPGMKYRVEWQYSDFERTYPEVHVKEVELPRYDTPGDVYVVFYPGHEVEVLVSPAEPGHSEWAGRVKESPWNACVAEHGRKVCKRAIPKPGLSLAEMQGYCTYVQEEGRNPEFCSTIYAQCLANYEDKELCQRTLWGERKK